MNPNDSSGGYIAMLSTGLRLGIVSVNDAGWSLVERLGMQMAKMYADASDNAALLAEVLRIEAMVGSLGCADLR